MLIDYFPILVMWLIIAIIMVVFYGSVAGVLAAGAVSLYIFGYTILSIVLAMISVYLFIESGRWAYWREAHYNESDGTINKAPPRNLIKEIIRWLFFQTT